MINYNNMDEMASGDAIQLKKSRVMRKAVTLAYNPLTGDLEVFQIDGAQPKILRDMQTLYGPQAVIRVIADGGGAVTLVARKLSGIR